MKTSILQRAGLLGFVVFVACACGSEHSADQAANLTSVSKADTTTQAKTIANLPGRATATNPALTQRAVIRKGSLTIRVPDVERAEKEVGAYASQTGGFVEKSESTDLGSPTPTMVLTVRIPSPKFDEAIAFFESKGTRLEKSISGEDVTGKLVDFEARLKIMAAEEESLRLRLKKTDDQARADILEQRIMQLRGDIESMAGQRKALAGLASLSTLELKLVGSAKPLAQNQSNDWPKESVNGATTLLTTVAQGIGTGAIFALVLMPIWGPVGYLIWLAIRRYRVSNA